MKLYNLKNLFLATLTFLALHFPAEAQIPNASFEIWTDCIPDDWASPNVCGVLTPVSKSTTAASGNFALRGEVVEFFTQIIAPVVQSGDDATGFPISQRYNAVEGSYMFSPAGGDRFGVNVAFLRDDAVVAQGAIAISTPASAYTRFTVPMTYQTTAIPNKAIIQIQIFGPVTGSDYHVGSIMHVDDLSFPGEALPSLSIRRNGPTVIVSWPATVTGYLLQSTPSLNTPDWGNVSGVAADNTYEFTPTTQGFFRLIKNQ
jgi:hypothetical protein